MNRREQDAHEDLCRRLVTALNERDAARAEVAAVRGTTIDMLAKLPTLCLEKRRREGLSLRAAAEQIEGVSFNTLTRFEHRASECRVDHVVAILRWLDTAAAIGGTP